MLSLLTASYYVPGNVVKLCTSLMLEMFSKMANLQDLSHLFFFICSCMNCNERLKCTEHAAGGVTVNRGSPFNMLGCDMRNCAAREENWVTQLFFFSSFLAWAYNLCTNTCPDAVQIQYITWGINQNNSCWVFVRLLLVVSSVRSGKVVSLPLDNYCVIALVPGMLAGH